VYCSSQLSDFSSAAATHTCPKLSQYLSQRPLYGAVSTSAMQSAQVTPLSTSGQLLNPLQHELSVGGAGQEGGASGKTHLHSMSDVPEMA